MVVQLAINFENDSRLFYPGEVVRGRVVFGNTADIKVKGLTLTFFGEVEVYWTESEVRYHTRSSHHSQSQPEQQTPSRRHVQREYRNQETILCHEILLFGQSDAEGGTEVTVSPGRQEYPFSVRLPMSGLPSTFNSSPFGNVKYTVEARLKQPLFKYDRIEEEFFISGILDLNFIPLTLQPFGIDKRVDLGWICCPYGSMTLDLKLRKTGFIPGEPLQFSVNILNLSTVTVSQLHAVFTQDMEFITFDRKKISSTDLEFSVYGDLIEDGSVREWNDSFLIPHSLLPTNLAGCRIINISYKLTIFAKSLRGDTLSVAAPIVIGTGPCSLHSSAMPPVLNIPPQAYEVLTFTANSSPAHPSAGSSEQNERSNVQPALVHHDHEPVPLAFPSVPKLQTEILLNNNDGEEQKYKPSLNPFLDADEVDFDEVEEVQENTNSSINTNPFV